VVSLHIHNQLTSLFCGYKATHCPEKLKEPGKYQNSSTMTATVVKLATYTFDKSTYTLTWIAIQYK